MKLVYGLASSRPFILHVMLAGTWYPQPSSGMEEMFPPQAGIAASTQGGFLVEFSGAKKTGELVSLAVEADARLPPGIWSWVGH